MNVHSIVKHIGMKISIMKNRFIYSCLDDEKGKLKRICLHFLLRGRKICCFYGFCHMPVYKKILMDTKEFKKQYLLLGGEGLRECIRLYPQYINKKSAWDKADVFVYAYGILGGEGVPTVADILEWLPEETVIIPITNAAFKGYMPQHAEKGIPDKRYFNWGDKNLNDILMGKRDSQELDRLKDNEYYSKEFVNHFFDKSLKKLNNYEENCVVKIADYLEAHGRKRILYHSFSHPEPEVMLELGKRLANVLGIESIKTNIEEPALNLTVHEEAVYPSVIHGLGIENGAGGGRRIRPGNEKVDYTFEEYLQQYMDKGREKLQLEHQ